MAKILYENRYILTKKLYKQYCCETYKKMRKSTQRLALILAAITLLIGITVFILFPKIIFIVIFGIIFLYFILMFFFGYSFSEWFNYRSLKRDYGEKSGGEIIYQLKFEPSEVRVKVGESSYTFKYTTIEKAYETDDLLIFILSTKGMIEHGQIIFKKGFTNKDSETLNNFKKLINEKSKKPIFNI